jgi:predicted Holliday junction resolvase-like endonuclease
MIEYLLIVLLLVVGMAAYYGQKHMRSQQDELNLLRAKVEHSCSRGDVEELVTRAIARQTAREAPAQTETKRLRSHRRRHRRRESR